MTEVAQGVARAGAMLNVKRYEQAVSLLASIVATEPDNSRAWCLLSLAHVGNSHYQEAAAVAGRAVALAPSDDWPHRVASMVLMKLGNTTASLRAFE
jgi:predicted Zn-dependent protease